MSDCVVWSTPQVNLTTSHNLNVSGKFMEFIFVFSSEMNFTNFFYENFLNLNQSDPRLDLTRDFTILYSQIDNWSFKIRLTANLGVHFVDQLFCAVTLV